MKLNKEELQNKLNGISEDIKLKIAIAMMIIITLISAYYLTMFLISTPKQENYEQTENK